MKLEDGKFQTRIRVRDQGRKIHGDCLAVPAIATVLSRSQKMMERWLIQFGYISSGRNLVEIGLEMFHGNVGCCYTGVSGNFLVAAAIRTDVHLGRHIIVPVGDVRSQSLVLI